MFQRAQVAGRDLRMARTAAQVAESLAAIQQIAEDGRTKLLAIQSQAEDASTQSRLKAIGGHFNAYVEALNDVGKKQIDILALFGRRDEVEAKWTRTFNSVINSGLFGLTPNDKVVEAYVNEAAFAQFKDARTSGWRYFVLNEAAQIGAIERSLSEALLHLGYAQRDAAEKQVSNRSAGLFRSCPDSPRS